MDEFTDVKALGEAMAASDAAQATIGIPLATLPVLDANKLDSMDLMSYRFLLETHGIPTTKEGQNLTTVGQIAMVLEEHAQFKEKIAQASLVIPEPPKLDLAKQMLAESFKWLLMFDQTADLRQRIKLFINIT